jgi:hypothetical protein
MIFESSSIHSTCPGDPPIRKYLIRITGPLIISGFYAWETRLSDLHEIAMECKDMNPGQPILEVLPYDNATFETLLRRIF